MIILVDQDQVIAAFEQGWLDQWRALYPERPHVPLEARRSFYISDDYPPQYRDDIDAIRNAPGFFAGLDPLPGAIGTLTTLLELGHEVFITTAPLSEYRNCVLEKYLHIDAHLGREWTKRIVMTKDKTLVHGDVLIDDKPHVTGIRTPDWVHVRYTQPPNATLDVPRLTWDDALDVLAAIEPELPARRAGALTGPVTTG